MGRRVIAGADAVLSVMEVDSARIALELGKRLHVVDSLLWMRETVPPEFSSAESFWAQNFVGVPERAAQIESRPKVVGPLVGPPVAPPAGRGSRRRQELVVNLGGLESPYAPRGTVSPYPEFVLSAVIASDLQSAFADGITVMAGAEVIERLRDRFSAPGVRLTSLSHEAAASAITRAQMVLTSPGLTTSLECFSAGVPTFFLPPQNFSQWWILIHLRARGLAPSSFHWLDVPGEQSLPRLVPLESRIPTIRNMFRRLMGDESVELALREALAGVLEVEHEALVDRQGEFYRSLGTPGSQQIIAAISR